MKPCLSLFANWKMNGDLAMCKSYFSKLFRALEQMHFKSSEGRGAKPGKVDLCVAPPAPYLQAAKRSLASALDSLPAPLIRSLSASIGAQNVHSLESGAHTGETSAHMLSDLGVKHCLIGHSESRARLFKSEGDIEEMRSSLAKSILLCSKYGISPVLCVGYVLRKGGVEEILNEVSCILDRIKAYTEKESQMTTGCLDKLFIAYEPVQAIGSGRVADYDDVRDVSRDIRLLAKEFPFSSVNVLYGGSVNDENCIEILEYAEVDGLLVGGVSLKVDQFAKLIFRCMKYSSS